MSENTNINPTDEQIEWDIDANVPMYTRDYLRLEREKKHEFDDTYVGKWYEMDPETEDILFEGRDLRPGMRVLLEDPTLRVDLESTHISQYEIPRARENNRWCTVDRVAMNRSYEQVSFIAVYDDGFKTKRTYGDSWSWIVKKDSIPSHTESDPVYGKELWKNNPEPISDLTD